MKESLGIVGRKSEWSCQVVTGNQNYGTRFNGPSSVPRVYKSHQGSGKSEMKANNLKTELLQLSGGSGRATAGPPAVRKPVKSHDNSAHKHTPLTESAPLPFNGSAILIFYEISRAKRGVFDIEGSKLLQLRSQPTNFFSLLD